MSQTVQQQREAHVRFVAFRILKDYGNDPDAYGDRLLEITNGNHALADAVSKHLDYLAGRNQRRRNRKAA